MHKISCLAATIIVLLSLAGCASQPQLSDASGEASLSPKPAVSTDDAKKVVMADRGRIWKDPYSIRDAKIGEAYVCRRDMLNTSFADLSKPATCICIEANAKNSFGGYTGSKRTIVRFLEAGKIETLDGEALNFDKECTNLKPFPELSAAASR